MTGLLKDVLQDRAQAETPPLVNVDAVVSAGRRRVRNRNAAGLLGTLALAVGVVGGVTALDGSVDRTDRSGVATTDIPSFRGMSYAMGSTIHVGDTTIDTGEVVRSYVATDDGFVWTVPSGDVMFGDGTTIEKIGHTSTDRYYLKSDDSGSIVAWVEFSDGRPPEFVAYDTSERAEVLRTDEGNVAGMGALRDVKDPAYIYAVDDGSLYWHSHEGVVRYDIAGQQATALGDGNGFTIVDVANGLIAYRTDETRSSQDRIVLGRSLSEGRRMPHSGEALLSPAGTYVAFEDADEMFVNKTATAADVTPRVPGYDYAVVYGWLDDGTATVFGVSSTDKQGHLPVGFFSCTIATGACEKTGQTTIKVAAFAWPNGEYIGG